MAKLKAEEEAKRKVKAEARAAKIKAEEEAKAAAAKLKAENAAKVTAKAKEVEKTKAAVTNITTPKKVAEKVAVATPVAGKAGAAGCLPSWLLGLLGVLLLGLIGWLIFRSCNSDTTTAVAAPKVEKVAPVVKEEPVVETKPEPAPVKTALCPNVSSSKLRLSSSSVAGEIADCLSDPNCQLPKIFTMKAANFDTNEATMTQSGKNEIPAIAKVLNNCDNCRINIYGHIDAGEKEEYNGKYQDGNITLSAIRARCLYKRLNNRNVPLSKMEFKGLGKTKLINNSTSGPERLKNRRVEIEVLPK